MRFIFTLGVTCLAAVNALPARYDYSDEKHPRDILNVLKRAVEPPENGLIGTRAPLPNQVHNYYPSDRLPTTKLEYENGVDYLETAKNFVAAMYPRVHFMVLPDNYVGTNGVGHVHFMQAFEGEPSRSYHLTVNVSPGSSFFPCKGWKSADQTRRLILKVMSSLLEAILRIRKFRISNTFLPVFKNDLIWILLKL